MAEDAAWKFANENKIDMVVINPCMVAGPLLQPEVNFSVEPILNLVNGNLYLLKLLLSALPACLNANLISRMVISLMQVSHFQIHLLDGSM